MFQFRLVCIELISSQDAVRRTRSVCEVHMVELGNLELLGPPVLLTGLYCVVADAHTRLVMTRRKSVPSVKSHPTDK